MNTLNILEPEPEPKQPKHPKGSWRRTETEVFHYLKLIGARTNKQIAQHFNLSEVWVGQVTFILYKAGRIYISGWKRKQNAGKWKRIYSVRMDKEKDEPIPDKVSASESMKRYRAKLKHKELIHVTTGTNLGS